MKEESRGLEGKDDQMALKQKDASEGRQSKHGITAALDSQTKCIIHGWTSIIHEGINTRHRVKHVKLVVGCYGKRRDDC